MQKDPIHRGLLYVYFILFFDKYTLLHTRKENIYIYTENHLKINCVKNYLLKTSDKIRTFIKKKKKRKNTRKFQKTRS